MELRYGDGEREGEGRKARGKIFEMGIGSRLEYAGVFGKGGIAERQVEEKRGEKSGGMKRGWTGEGKRAGKGVLEGDKGKM